MSMLGWRARTIVITALLAMMTLLALLAWRGVKALEGKNPPPTLRWREADETDLF